MKKAVLHIMQGFIGAGKSTYAKNLALEFGAVHLNPDAWVTERIPKEEYMRDWDKYFAAAVEAIWQEAAKHLADGTDVVLDMGFWFRKDRDYAKMIAEKSGAGFKHYYIYAPDEILKQRIVASRPPEWAAKHLENFAENKKKFQEPEKDEMPIVIQNYSTSEYLSLNQRKYCHE